MPTLKMYDTLQKRALVTRQSATIIQEVLAAILRQGDRELSVDFSGIDAITPSFIDETLWILKQHLQRYEESEFRIIFLNPPTRLSSKFVSVGRAHELEMEETESGSWVINSRISTPR